MRRWLLTLFAVFALVAAACGGGDDTAGDDLPPVEDGVTPEGTIDTEPTETAPPTTDTIPPEAVELPDLQIVFVEFGDEGFVEIANVGDTDADVDGIQLCQFPTYLDIGPIAGGTIAAGESIRVSASGIGGLSADGGEAALYSSPDFTNPEAIFGFVQWGTGGARAEVATEAGIWPAGASIEPDPAFNSIELFGDPADPESWS